MYERTGYDWRSVGQLLNNDPIPGSPDELERIASGFRHQADNLGRAAGNLRLLQNRDDTCSEAVTKIMTKASDTAASLDAVKQRYETIGRALEGYAPELREAQRMSIEAVTKASEASRRKQAAAARVESARWRFVSFDEQVRNEAQEDYYRSKADYEHATGDVAGAQALLREAISKRDGAGNQAASQLKDDISSGELNDTVWDHIQVIGDAVVEVGQFLWDNLDIIASIVSVAAAFFPVLAPVALALRVLTYVKMGVELLGGAIEGFKTGNWNNAIKAGITIGTTLLFAKFGPQLMDKAGRAGSKFVTKTVDAKNYLLKHTTDGKVATALLAAEKNKVPVAQIFQVARTNPVVAPYREGANLSAAFHLAQNPGVRGSAHELTALIKLSPSGDMRNVMPALKEVERIMNKVPISDAARDSMAHFADKTLREGVHQVPDAVDKIADMLFPAPKEQEVAGTCSTYRVTGGGR